MAILKCKMCGGDLEIIEGSSICVCEYCDTQQTVPNVDDERKVTLFVRANKLRSVNEFDKAYSIYESLTEDFPEEAEAYWGLVLCKYGIEYVDDPKTGKKIPTCHRSSFNSVLEDENYLKTLSQCDVLAREVYKKEALAIEELRKGIIEISAKEEPYDIFICYKETDRQGQRTHDSVLAQSIYGELTEKGYRVFFSRISLEDKLGVKYEPYIFSALHSARVMLVVGMDGDNLNAVWVKNEWSRYLKLIEAGEKKTLIPCYRGIDAYDLPEEFADLQAQDMGKIGAMQDLLHGIGKVISKQASTVTVTQAAVNGPSIENLQKRASMALSDGDFKKADELFEKILEIDNSYALGYLGLDMVRHQVKSCKELALAYAENGKELSSNLKEAKRLSPNASWVVEFEKEYATQLEIIKEQAKRAEEERVALENIKRVCEINNGKIVNYKGNDRLLVIPKGITSIGEFAFNGCASLISVVIPDSVTHIGKRAFENCSSLISVKFGNGVTSIAEGAFNGCPLTSVVIPNNVTSIGNYAFRDCSFLTSVIISDCVTSLRPATFWGCKSLTSVVIPKSVTGIGGNAFYNCKSLTSVAIGDSVTWIGCDAFKECTSLESVEIPNGLTNIGHNAFRDCTSLKNVTIRNTATVIEKGPIGEYAFSGCKSLTSITIPDGVADICSHAFEGCVSLTNITIPNSVTSIGFYAFQNCKSLENITIPNSIDEKRIGCWAFKGCKFVKKRKKQGVCVYCGGKYKGLFTKTCTSCGRGKYRK